MSVLGYFKRGSLKPILAPSADENIVLNNEDKVVVVADLV